MALTKPEFLNKWTNAAGAAALGAALTLSPLSAAHAQSANAPQATSLSQLPAEGSFVTAKEAEDISRGCGVVVIHEGRDIGGTQASAWVLRTDENIQTVSLKGDHLGYAQLFICGIKGNQTYSQDDIHYGKITQAVRENQPKILNIMQAPAQTAALE